MVGLAELFLYFLVYSIFGWAFETICCAVIEKKLVSRGFLMGPWCPIYGLGGIILAVFVDDFTLPPVLNLLAIIGICTVFEYLSSVVLEKLFGVRWWDYSGMPFNLNGRICLWASLGFGMVGWFVLFVLRPWFAKFLAHLSGPEILAFGGIMAVIFFTDLLVSGTFAISYSREHKGRMPKREDQTREIKKYIRKRLQGKAK